MAQSRFLFCKRHLGEKNKFQLEHFKDTKGDHAGATKVTIFIASMQYKSCYGKHVLKYASISGVCATCVKGYYTYLVR